MNNKHQFNLNPNNLNATFTFDFNTGKITNKINAVIPDDTEEFNKLIEEAEEIKSNPDYFLGLH